MSPEQTRSVFRILLNLGFLSIGTPHMTDTDTNTPHTNYYILNREYFSECFDQTANTETSFKTYFLAIALASIACALFMSESETYIAWFLLCLSGVELLSIRYKRAWWIARQMISRAAGSKVNIRIDDEGISTQRGDHQQIMLWADITGITRTEKGFVISHATGNHYLSNSCLDDGALALLNTRV